MTCVKLTELDAAQLAVYDGTVKYRWSTDWQYLWGIDTVDAVINVRDPTNNFEIKPVYQTCAVRAEIPDAPTVFVAGKYSKTAGYTHWRETGMSSVAGFLIRFGAAYKQTSGSVALAAGVAETRFAIQSCTTDVGEGSVSIRAGMVAGTEVNYFPIGSFVPTIGLSKAMATFVWTDNAADYLEYQLICRTAIDEKEPNAWQTCEVGWSNPNTTNGERRTSALPLPAGAQQASNLLVQFGVAARQRSGAGFKPQAEIVSKIIVDY